MGKCKYEIENCFYCNERIYKDLPPEFGEQHMCNLKKSYIEIERLKTELDKMIAERDGAMRLYEMKKQECEQNSVDARAIQVERDKYKAALIDAADSLEYVSLWKLLKETDTMAGVSELRQWANSRCRVARAVLVNKDDHAV